MVTRGRKPKLIPKSAKKVPLNRAFTKILPKIYERIEYTPQELWLKFSQYIERSDKNSEEITISWFSVFAHVSSTYLFDKKWSQDFSNIIDMIMTVYESRYEQSAKRADIKYLMNNRFKWKRESVQKVEETHNLHPDVKWVLDQIIYKKSPDGTK